jgi:hypothetical protein
MTDLGSVVFSVRTMGAGPPRGRAVIWDPLTVGIGSDDAPNGAAGCRRSACTYVPTFPRCVGTFDQSRATDRRAGAHPSETRQSLWPGRDDREIEEDPSIRRSPTRPRCCGRPTCEPPRDRTTTGRVVISSDGTIAARRVRAGSFVTVSERGDVPAELELHRTEDAAARCGG